MSATPSQGRPGDLVKVSFVTRNTDGDLDGYWLIDECGAGLLKSSSTRCVISGTNGSVVLRVPQNLSPGPASLGWFVAYELVTRGTRDGTATPSGRGDGSSTFTVLPAKTSPAPRDPSDSPSDQGIRNTPAAETPTSPPPSVAERSASDPLRRGIPLVIALLAGLAATLLARWLRRGPKRRPAERGVRVVPHPDRDIRVRIREAPGNRMRAVRLDPHSAVMAVEIQETRR